MKHLSTPLICCVHATPRALPQTGRLFAALGDGCGRQDIVEEALLEAANRDDGSCDLFLKTLRQAEATRPAAILTTCSMYTRHLPKARAQLATPLLGIDEPMIEQAAQIGGRLALVGSLEPSINLTAEQILQRAESLGVPTQIAKRELVALDAAATHTAAEQLATQLRQLCHDVDAVVVVQLSLSAVADHLTAKEQETILTSPPLALGRLRRIVTNPNHKS